MVVNERVKDIVRLVRLDLYNHGLTCGAEAVRRQLDEVYELKPLPSVRTIRRILASGLMDHPVPVPWCNGLSLRLTTP
jgi:hypothetical protein